MDRGAPRSLLKTPRNRGILDPLYPAPRLLPCLRRLGFVSTGAGCHPHSCPTSRFEEAVLAGGWELAVVPGPSPSHSPFQQTPAQVFVSPCGVRWGPTQTRRQRCQPLGCYTVQDACCLQSHGADCGGRRPRGPWKGGGLSSVAGELTWRKERNSQEGTALVSAKEFVLPLEPTLQGLPTARCPDTLRTPQAPVPTTAQPPGSQQTAPGAFRWPGEGCQPAPCQALSHPLSALT